MARVSSLEERVVRIEGKVDELSTRVGRVDDRDIAQPTKIDVDLDCASRSFRGLD